MMLTEHPLDTIQNDDLPPEKRNICEKSIVLAPYNSQVKLDDTLEQDDFEIKFEPKAVKFKKKVKELNRQYEQNNNAELDNGIINQVIQE